MSIFLDFDRTITTEDTITHLAEFALRFQLRPPQSHDVARDDDLSSRWDDVVRAYLADYQSHVSSYAPCADNRLSVDDEIAFLVSLKHVETNSLRRINECALFRGISRNAFRAAGRELVRDGTVRLRPGFVGFVRAALGKGWRVYIVSVNWSAAFIEGACGFTEGEVCVFANEVRESDGAVLGPCNGLLAGDEHAPRNLTNSRDKRDVVRAVIRGLGADGKPFFYFGDSTTDMECLLEASRGVVVADDEVSTLLRTLKRIGKRVPHARDANDSDDLIWVSNFEEFMEGPGLHLV
ncbi:hypothetical protein GGS21DRAFT_336495 [Xylaria nigripes]|nr:hypothetical protein GGS21DRAFT_336495 [Xylaria nigripes]